MAISISAHRCFAHLRTTISDVNLTSPLRAVLQTPIDVLPSNETGSFIIVDERFNVRRVSSNFTPSDPHEWILTLEIHGTCRAALATLDILFERHL
jgi:hypothetical protein